MALLDWQRWLAELRSTPADATEWDGADEFAQDVLGIAQAKRQERGSYSILGQALADLLDERKAEIEFFGFADCASWQPLSCPSAQATGCASQVQRLGEKLDEHSDLLRRSNASLAGRRQLREPLDATEQQVLDLHASLAATFTRTPIPPSPPALPPEDVTPSAEATRASTGPSPVPQAQAPSAVVVGEASSVPLAGIRRASRLEPEAVEPNLFLTIGKRPAEGLKAALAAASAPSGAITGSPTKPLPSPTKASKTSKKQLARPTKPALSSGRLSTSDKEALMHRPMLAAPDAQADESEPVEAQDLPEAPPVEMEDATPLDEIEEMEAETPPAPLPPVAEPTMERGTEAPQVLAESAGPEEAPARALADQVLAPEELAEAEDLEAEAGLWSLLEEDDLAGALWAARSLWARGVATSVPAWTLAAVLGARCLEREGDAIADGLGEIVAHSVEAASIAESLLRLAAALRPALLAPTASSMEAWLEVPDACQSILCEGARPLLQAVREFTGNRIALRPGDLEVASGHDQRAQAFLDLSDKARDWLAGAQAGRTQHRRSSDVRQHLVRHELSQMLEPVIKDRRSDLAAVRAQVEKWRDRNAIVARIAEIDQKLIGMRMAAIPRRLRPARAPYVLGGRARLQPAHSLPGGRSGSRSLRREPDLWLARSGAE